MLININHVTEGKGVISRKDFSDVMVTLTPSMSSQDVSELFEAYDGNQDGHLDYSEFVNFVFNRQKGQEPEGSSVARARLDIPDVRSSLDRIQAGMALTANIYTQSGVMVDVTDMAGSSLYQSAFPMDALVQELKSRITESILEWESKEIVILSDDGVEIQDTECLRDHCRITVQAKVIVTGDYQSYHKEMIDGPDYCETTIRLHLGEDRQASLSWKCNVFLRHGDGGCDAGDRSETSSGGWEMTEQKRFALKFDDGKLAGKTILGTVDDGLKIVNIEEFRSGGGYFTSMRCDELSLKQV